MASNNETSKNKEILLAEILADPWLAIRTMQKHVLPAQLLRELADQDSSLQVRIFLAAQSNTPGRILDHLINSSELEVLRVLAGHAHLTFGQLQRLSKHEDVQVRMALAGNKGINGPIAVTLCSDPAMEVRLALAANAVISPRIQAILSSDACSLVRAELLKLSRLDEEVQFALCDDWDLLIHIKTLLSPRLSFNCLKNWAASGELVSQLAIAARKSVPEEIWGILSLSTHRQVQLLVLGRGIVTAEQMLQLARDGDEEVRHSIARRAELSLPLQRILSQDSREEVRLALAANPCLDDGIGRFLAQGRHGKVLAALAQNPGALEATRTVLISDGDSQLHKLLLANPALAGEELSALLEVCAEEVFYHLAYRRRDCSFLSSRAKERLLQSGLPAVRRLAIVAKV
ncbi:MAG: hypothetical protein WCT05_09885 [Lentisphaeria bacterium]